MSKGKKKALQKEMSDAWSRSVVSRKIGLKPLHPGDLIREEFLIPLGMTPRMLARKIRVPERPVIAIVRERQGLDGEMCLRLARFFRMRPEFWMNCQKGFELQEAAPKWRQIRKQVPMHPKDRKTGALKMPKATK